ncbi:hypothetical protein [Paenibacillus sp. SN-8-1]|uniref:hypothetical protein n=1 Tax=Paenibacillus sp. SN-8-1 TaxID=3435409 RepID=UPI003D9A820E
MFKLNFSNILSNIDNYIVDNNKNLTCHELANLYLEFIMSLKSKNLNSNNLTGLTEIIFSRAFYYYNKRAIDSGIITVSHNIDLAGQQPDLVVFLDEQPIASIEVKSNFSNIKQDCERHEKVLKKYPNINLLTVAFEVQNQSHRKNINKLVKEYLFYKVLILNESQMPFQDVLRRYGLIF